MYDACNEWTKNIGKNKFSGGETPNLADLVRTRISIAFLYLYNLTLNLVEDFCSMVFYHQHYFLKVIVKFLPVRKLVLLKEKQNVSYV